MKKTKLLYCLLSTISGSSWILIQDMQCYGMLLLLQIIRQLRQQYVLHDCKPIFPVIRLNDVWIYTVWEFSWMLYPDSYDCHEINRKFFEESGSIIQDGCRIHSAKESIIHTSSSFWCHKIFLSVV